MRAADHRQVRRSRKADVHVTGHGTLYTVALATEAARQWVAAHVDVPEHGRLGDGAFVVEHRYIAPLVEGMRANGLEVIT